MTPVNAKGRYVPPKKPKPAPPSEPLAWQYGLKGIVPRSPYEPGALESMPAMPACYPEMSFMAHVGRAYLSSLEEAESGEISNEEG